MRACARIHSHAEDSLYPREAEWNLLLSELRDKVPTLKTSASSPVDASIDIDSYSFFFVFLNIPLMSEESASVWVKNFICWLREKRI